MVAKGTGSAQVARMRRTGADAEAPAPLKLKKKVVAVRSDAPSPPPPASTSTCASTTTSSPSTTAPSSAASSEHAPAGDAPPSIVETPPLQGWKQLKPAKREDADSSSALGPQRSEQPGDSSPKNAPQTEESESSTSMPLVAIAPAKPGTMLPKDMIMAKYRVKPDAPKFLLMLYEILQHESTQVIRWTEDGLALQILDQANVTEKVLPKYFNHTNFHSFQRQLNYFGFRKWTKSKTDICTFSHPYFRRNQPELMHLIKRKKATRRAGTGEQPENAYAAEAYSTGASTTVSIPSTTIATSVAPKKLLPLSPSGKRRLAPDPSEDRERRGFHESSGPKPATSSAGAALPALTNHQPLAESSEPPTGHGYASAGATVTNAISPASGGAKKKAKTGSAGKSFNPPDLAPSGSVPPPAMLTDPAAISALGIPPGAFPKGALPNLDLVRNRLIYRQPQTGVPGSMPTFTSGFPIAPNLNPQLQPAGSESNQNATSSGAQPTNNSTPVTDGNSMFSNSFSDPVDILLRIKKSRAMSQDNTLLQSPQQSQGQVEGFASLQNFLLSQSMYTNRLESQLKLAMEENEALRHLVDAKQREVEALLNERKMIQNENSVLTEDKNKLFEINRDLLSKLFPQ